jgi:hypothetical protein
VGAENPVMPGDVHVPLQKASGSVSSKRPDGGAGGRGSAVCGRVLTEGSMWAVRVVVLDELLQHQREVARPGDPKVVEAFAAQRSDEALCERVRPRRPHGGAEDADVGAGEHGVDGGV